MLFFNNKKGRVIAIFFWVFLLMLKVGCVYWEVGVGWGGGIYAYVIYFFLKIKGGLSAFRFVFFSMF